MLAYVLFVMAGLALAPVLVVSAADAQQWDKPTHGPPTSLFRGGSSLPIDALAAAAKAGRKSLASYHLGSSDPRKASIFGDWASLQNGGAYFWTADMDVDCDGINYQCEGNADGQAQTSFGALSAYAVPFIVIPGEFSSAHTSELPGNNVVAVICNGNLFYGIFGDTNGDTPESIGEASWLMARACFPADSLNGNNGHTFPDVTYIVFKGHNAVLPSYALDNTFITDFTTLKTMGDYLTLKLVTELGL